MKQAELYGCNYIDGGWRESTERMRQKVGKTAGQKREPLKKRTEAAKRSARGDDCNLTNRNETTAKRMASHANS
jgi:hypothetical protein